MIVEFAVNAARESPIHIDSELDLRQHEHVSVLGDLDVNKDTAWMSHLSSRDGKLLSGVEPLSFYTRDVPTLCKDGCLLFRAWDTSKKLPCKGVNQVLQKHLKWERPAGSPNVYWQTPKQAIKVGNGAEWSFTVYKSVWQVPCEGGEECVMSKTIACSYQGTEDARENCCTQKQVLSAAALTDQGIVDFKLGESKARENLLGSTWGSTDAMHTQGWRWPAGLPALVPKVVGADTIVVGQTSLPYPGAVSNEELEAMMQSGGCVTSGFNALLGTAANQGASIDSNSRISCS